MENRGPGNRPRASVLRQGCEDDAADEACLRFAAGLQVGHEPCILLLAQACGHLDVKAALRFRRAAAPGFLLGVGHAYLLSVQFPSRSLITSIRPASSKRSPPHSSAVMLSKSAIHSASGATLPVWGFMR